MSTSLFAAAIVGIAAALVWVLWQVPRLQVRAARRRLPPMAENEYRKSLAQILGGLLVLGGFFFTWAGLRDSQKQLALLESGQVTERFSRAVEQLAGKGLSERLGGIYALERIAADSGRDHWAVMEMLAAFAREHQPDQCPAQLPEDVRAAVTVIGRRVREDPKGKLKPGEWNQVIDTKGHFQTTGNRLNLQGVLMHEIDLNEANLSGAYLSRACLSNAHLYDADLSYVYLNLADLRGARLQEANLREAVVLWADLSRASLMGADLRGARLEEANLSEANLSEANLRETNLRGANLRGARLDAAKGLSQEQVQEAEGDAHTLLPPGLVRPDHWQ